MPKNLLKKTFNFFQKIFDKTIRSCYHIQVSGKQTEQNSIRPDGQAVKTTPSHGVNPGSIPGQVTCCCVMQQHFLKVLPWLSW